MFLDILSNTPSQQTAMLLLNSEDVFCYLFIYFFCGHVFVNFIDIGYFHSVYFYICCLLLHFPPGLGSKICQSRPEKKNISAAVGCLHETACRRHLNISSICYPSWPKLSLSFTARFRLRFQLPKTLCGPSRTWYEEKRCRCKDFPFYSINILFIGRACLSEEQEYLYPFTSVTQDDSWHEACGSECRHLFHLWNMLADSLHKFSYPWLQILFDFLTANLFPFESAIYRSVTATQPY